MRAVFAGLALSLSLHAADRDFRDVVDSISSRVHARPLSIPFFGLLNMVAYVARPAGARHIDLAVWQDLDWSGENHRELGESIRAAVGGSWKPFVQVRSQREVTFVYMRPEGNDWRMLIVSVERRQATAVEVRLNADALQRWVMVPREAAMNR